MTSRVIPLTSRAIKTRRVEDCLPKFELPPHRGTMASDHYGNTWLELKGVFDPEELRQLAFILRQKSKEMRRRT